MTFMIRFLLVFIVAFIISWATLSASQRSLDGVDAIVQLDGAGTTRPHLSICLRNRSQLPVRLKRESLPWSPSRGAFLTIGELATNTPLRQILPVDQLWSSEVTLQSGEIISGSIELSQRFPDLARWNKRFELIVFWAFRIEAQDGAILRRHGSDLLPAQTR